MKKNIFIALFLLLNAFSYSQNSNLCLYSKNAEINQNSIFAPIPNDHDIIAIISSVRKIFNINQDFLILNDPGSNNAYATTYKGLRIIGYDPIFLQKISKGKKSIITSIIAHEIGHHLMNHTMVASNSVMEQRRRELEADYISSMIMYNLGFSLDEAIEGVSNLDDLSDDTFLTHPLREKRNLVITNVYESKTIDPENYISKVLEYSKSRSLSDLNSQNFFRAQKYIQEDKYSSAINEINKLTNNDKFLYLVGTIRKVGLYREIGKEEDALRTALLIEKQLQSNNFIVNSFEKAHKEQFIGDYIYFNIAGSYELLGQNLNALEYYKKAYNLRPNDKIIKSKIGILNTTLTNYEQAVYFLDDATLEEEYIRQNFSPFLLNKLLFSRLLSYEKANLPFEKVSKAYDGVLNNFKSVFSEKENFEYLTYYNSYLMGNFEKDKDIWNEIKINKLYQQFKQYRNLDKKESTKYLVSLLLFYEKYAEIFDTDASIRNEILQKLK